MNNYKNIPHGKPSCALCQSTYFSIKAKGYCKRCYPINRRIERLKLRLDKLSDTNLIKIERPILGKSFFQITDRTKIMYGLIMREQKSIKYLTIYGLVESGERKIDRIFLEMLLNTIAKRSGKSDKLFSQKLDSIIILGNEDILRNISLKLLTILI